MAAAMVALAAGGLFANPASAAGEDSSAFALRATGPVTVAPTPNAQCPPDSGPMSLATATLPGLLTANVLNAQCAGNTASSSVADATLLPSPTGGGLQLTAIRSECNGASGSSSVLDVNGRPVVGTFQVNTSLGLATVVIGEQTNENGFFTVNAVRITIPAIGEEIILAQSRCKAGPTPVIPESSIAIMLPLSAAVLFGGAYFLLRRRSAAAAEA